MISQYSVIRKYHSKTKLGYLIINKKLISSETKQLRFPLKQVTVEELIAARIAKVPSFVLKEEGKYYYTVIEPGIGFLPSTLLGPDTYHLCAQVGKECKRLSSASDELGGCKKVREKSTGIERYPWITVGYETFCTDHDSFVVSCCEHFVKPSSNSNHNLPSYVEIVNN